jgi:hypothetical protein
MSDSEPEEPREPDVLRPAGPSYIEPDEAQNNWEILLRPKRPQDAQDDRRP